jgi:hypothetical protein
MSPTLSDDVVAGPRGKNVDGMVGPGMGACQTEPPTIAATTCLTASIAGPPRISRG